MTGTFRAGLIVLFVAIVSACSGDPDTAPEATTAPAGGTPQPASSPRSAVEAFLAAEEAGDHAGSYRLLSPAARDAFTPATWRDVRRDVPAVTGFSIETVDGAAVTAIVEHEPGLDPFIGLSLARERHTYTALQDGRGWLLDPEPEVVPVLPRDADAASVASDWARAAQACDGDRARALQAVSVLFGEPSASTALCGVPGELSPGAAESLQPGPVSQALVTQYGTNAQLWARDVPVSGAPASFHVVLAPIGAAWRVVGVYAS